MSVFKLIKYLFYALLLLVIIFLYWFLPKYSYINQHPGYCANLTKHIYYCGNEAALDKLFQIGK